MFIYADGDLSGSPLKQPHQRKRLVDDQKRIEPHGLRRVLSSQERHIRAPQQRAD